MSRKINMKSHPVRSRFFRESFYERFARRRWLLLAAIALITLPSARLANAQGNLYFVNTTSDAVVAGACTNGAAGCSLRGAIQAANAHPGEDGIEISLSTSDPGFNGIFWTINLSEVLPDITDSVGIFGPGADKLTVRRNTSSNFRIFTVTTTGAVAFSGLTIRNGSETSGGGIAKFNTGIINITNSTISDNHTDASGGGVFNNDSGTVNITNSTLSGNTRGGIRNNGTGTVNVTNSTLSGNATSDSSGGSSGGGIYNESGVVNVTNSTLSGNTGVSGGGIFNSGGTVNVTNSTLSGNTADRLSGSSGGGIANIGTVVITNSTVAGNSATIGGGIRSTSGAMTVRSSIIASNTAGSGPDVDGSSFASTGFNLIGRNDGAAASFPTGNPNGNNDIVGTSASPIDPKLETDGMGKPLLKNNGGPTQTIGLVSGSPAIDQGTSNGSTGMLTTDQRGAGYSRTIDKPIANATGGDGSDSARLNLAPVPRRYRARSREPPARLILTCLLAVLPSEWNAAKVALLKISK
jgi:CSLREA domain-containing protein